LSENLPFEEFESKTITVLNKDNTTETINLTGSKITLNKNENSKVVLVNPVFDNGKLYNYHVDEISVSNFEKTLDQDKLTVTNTYKIPKINITGIKKWNDNKKSHPEVKFELWRKTSVSTEEKVKDATVVKNNKVDFGKQDETDVHGNKYEYFVKETTNLDNYSKHEEGLTVTNTPISDRTVSNCNPPKLDRKNHFAYIIGYPDSSFRPESNITRAEMATIFSRLLEERIILPNDYRSMFSDVHIEDWFSSYVGKLTQVGVISGYPDETFKPENKVTRAEFAAITSRFIKNKKTSSNFPDVSNQYWASESIEYVKSEGWIKGYPDGSFRPENNITRAEVVNIVNLMLDRYADKNYVDSHKNSLYSYTDLSKNHWAYYPIMEASNGHIYNRLSNNEESWIRHWTPEEQENFSSRWR
ncbi:S-layer homology domain-containing protein, partial [Peptoniphilus asaccharolyticus]